MTKTKEIDATIRELEGLAKDVLALKEEVIPRRPIVIEFCGSPKSGKTSCINSLDLFLRRNRFRTRVLTERASVCPVNNKYDPYFNLWTVSSAIAELSEVLANNSKDYDVVILDRGIFDALCWFSWLLEKDHLDKSNFGSIESFLLMNRWRSVIDIIYVFTASPAVSLKREFANLLTRKHGSIMHPEILSSYINQTKTVKSKYGKHFKKVEHVDTSVQGLNEVNYEVTKKILEILHDNTSERIGYIKRVEIDNSLPKMFELDKLFSKDIKLEFDARRKVEDSDSLVQPLPIVVITNKERSEVLIVKKNKRRTSERSPESQKNLLYLGGHIRQEDLIESSEKDVVSVAKYALHREIKEEIGYDYYPCESENPFCIWIRDDERSEKHLALCYIMERDLETMKIKLDKNEFMVSGRTKSGKFQKVSDIYKSYYDLEEWSQIILQRVFSLKPPGDQNDLALPTS